MCLWAAVPALPVSIPIENASFELPVVDPNVNYSEWPFVNGWIEIDLDTLSSANTGVFSNTPQGNPDHITNADGNQLAFLSSQEGNALEQDLVATYKAGRSYSLTVAVAISESPFSQLQPDDTIEIALYYSDPNDPNIHPDIISKTVEAKGLSSTQLQDFSVYLPILNSSDAWAGKTIGIAIRATGQAGGFWDLDNVRLEELLPVSIPIKNASFEFPVIDPLLNPFGADPNIDGWTEIDNAPLGDSVYTGVFANTEPNNVNYFGDHDHIFNADGNQMAFLGSEAGNALEQDLSAMYNIGCDYHLTVAVGTSFMFPPSTEEPIDYLELALYYRNDSEPVDIVSLLIPAMDPNQWLKDFSLSLLSVSADNPWAGKKIGVAIRAAGAAGGFWDLDNVRLEEFLPVSIPIKNASFEYPVIDPLNAFGAGPIVDDWVEIDVDPEGLSRNTGVFANTEPNSFDHIVNADGSQLAFLYSEEGNALEQELSDPYKPGCAYRLTAAIGVSSRLPPTILEPVGTLELAFYYRDVNESGESIDIVTRTIEATGLYPTKLRDYSLYLPASPSDDNWANKTICIAIRATGVPGAVWVLDNVRLGQSLSSEDFILTTKE